MNFPFRPDESLAAGSELPLSGLRGARPQALASLPDLSERIVLRIAGLSSETLDQVETLAGYWGVSQREAAIASGVVTAENYVKSVAQFYGLHPQARDDLLVLKPLSPLPEPYRLLESTAPTPLLTADGGIALNAESCAPETIGEISVALGADRRRLRLLSRAAMTSAIIRGYGDALATRAANGVGQRNPRFSAATGFIGWQLVALAIIAGLFLGAAAFAPQKAIVLYGGALSFMFLIVIALRVAAAIHAVRRRLFRRKTPARLLCDEDLPRYTVLVALFREARVLPQLVRALAAMDYPAAKLDIKLVLEAVDTETIACAHSLTLPPHFEILVVPDGAPRTKPKALNYALQFARGDLLVIYDAEDRPDPRQLRMAATHFADAPPEVVCLQAQLTFHNYARNWLSKQFTIEYASLFGGILPLLDRMRMPIPLGGTSNHFRTGILRKLGAWDSYNVTEDADLGMRIYRAGFRAEVIFSETVEEAACQPGNWLRQRTRWLKGWMQTYLVHMRQPRRLMRELGIAGFLAFQGHFAGIILAALVYPASFFVIAYGAATGWFLSEQQTLLGYHLLTIAGFNLVAGFASSFALGLFVMKRQHMAALLPQILMIPLYWLLISAAAYRALYQLITAPHYWEKTEHFGVAAPKAREVNVRRRGRKMAGSDARTAIAQPARRSGNRRYRPSGASQPPRQFRVQA